MIWLNRQSSFSNLLDISFPELVLSVGIIFYLLILFLLLYCYIKIQIKKINFLIVKQYFYILLLVYLQIFKNYYKIYCNKMVKIFLFNFSMNPFIPLETQKVLSEAKLNCFLLPQGQVYDLIFYSGGIILSISLVGLCFNLAGIDFINYDGGVTTTISNNMLVPVIMENTVTLAPTFTFLDLSLSSICYGLSVLFTIKDPFLFYNIITIHNPMFITASTMLKDQGLFLAKGIIDLFQSTPPTVAQLTPPTVAQLLEHELLVEQIEINLNIALNFMTTFSTHYLKILVEFHNDLNKVLNAVVITETLNDNFYLKIKIIFEFFYSFYDIHRFIDLVECNNNTNIILNFRQEILSLNEFLRDINDDLIKTIKFSYTDVIYTEKLNFLKSLNDFLVGIIPDHNGKLQFFNHMNYIDYLSSFDIDTIFLTTGRELDFNDLVDLLSERDSLTNEAINLDEQDDIFLFKYLKTKYIRNFYINPKLLVHFLKNLFKVL
jgi:hypothetical protein